MSFSQSIKQQLLSIKGLSNIELKAELYSFFYMIGEYKKKNIVIFSSDNSESSRKLLYLLKIFFKNKYTLKKQCKICFKKFIYKNEISLNDNNFFSKIYFPKTIKEKKSFLRGAFIARGSITDPKKNYHLEIRCSNFSTCFLIKKILNYFFINAKNIIRKNNFFIYIKNGEMISDFLKIIGAYDGLFIFENIRVIKEIKNTTNRYNNLDLANLDKTIFSANRQVKSIKKIQKIIGIEKLPLILKKTAYTRLEYPYFSLKELSKTMNNSLNKAKINYRLKKIEKIAKNL